jgi:hypothetical protein
MAASSIDPNSTNRQIHAMKKICRCRELNAEIQSDMHEMPAFVTAKESPASGARDDRRAERKPIGRRDDGRSARTVGGELRD